MPYMEAPLHNDPHVLEALLIYLKLGGEKMARIAIDAYNMNRRMLDAEMRKQLRDQMLLFEEQDESDEEKDDEGEDEDEEGEMNEDAL
jgi:hypothetical protein